MRNSKDINLFGYNLKLFERNAVDVLALEERYSSNKEIHEFHLSIQIVCDSLKYNFNTRRWYEFIKYFRYKKIITAKYIINNLSINEIGKIVSDVLALENRNQGKKKVPVTQSEEESQKV